MIVIIHSFVFISSLPCPFQSFSKVQEILFWRLTDFFCENGRDKNAGNSVIMQNTPAEQPGILHTRPLSLYHSSISSQIKSILSKWINLCRSPCSFCLYRYYDWPSSCEVPCNLPSLSKRNILVHEKIEKKKKIW